MAGACGKRLIECVHIDRYILVPEIMERASKIDSTLITTSFDASITETNSTAHAMPCSIPSELQVGRAAACSLARDSPLWQWCMLYLSTVLRKPRKHVKSMQPTVLLRESSAQLVFTGYTRKMYTYLIFQVPEAPVRPWIFHNYLIGCITIGYTTITS